MLLFNELKILDQTWNDELELPDGSDLVSNFQDYIEYIIKNTKHLQRILQLAFTSTGLIID